MAFPRELVHTVAKSLGRAEHSLLQVDRQLQEAGLRASGGRGRSSAKADAKSAAALLIAVAGAPLFGPGIAQAAGTFSRYADLPSTFGDAGSKPLTDAWAAVPELVTLAPQHTFFEALTKVIEAAEAGRIPMLTEPQGHGIKVPSRTEVRLSGPWPFAAISIHIPGIGYYNSHYQELFEQSRDKDLVEWAQKRNERFGEGDLHEHRYFTDATIRPIGDLLAGRAS